MDAVTALDESTMFRQALGDRFVDYFLHIKRAGDSKVSLNSYRLGAARIFRALLNLPQFCPITA